MISRALVLMVSIGVGSISPARAQDPPETETSARLLQIKVVAVDREGNPIKDLDREALEVWIGGYRVPIETFACITPETADRPGRLLVLILDDITLPLELIPRAKEAARRIVTRMLPGDRMAVVMLNGGVVEISDDPSRLMRRIEAHKQSIGAIPIDQIGAHVLGTITAVARQVVESPELRKTIVAIGSGWLLDTPVPPPHIGRDLRRESQEAIRAMGVADITYYVIDPAGVGASRTSGAAGLARETGGHAFTNTNDINGAVDRILREAGHYCAVTVRDPPVGRKSPLRELEVRSLRQGITIRAARAIPGGGK